MDVVPLHRHPGFIFLLGFGITAGLYYWAVNAAIEFVTPGLLTDIILILGLFSAVALFIFIANLLFWIRETKKMLAAFFRLAILGAWIPINIYVLLGNSVSVTRTIFTHLNLGLIALLIITGFIAQFVLPVRKPKERLAAFRRLLGFLIGERGPVTFIRNGEAKEAYGEQMRRAPGVFLIDYASTAVLRTTTHFTRPVGPGVTFSHRGEWRAESLDLRRQVRTTKGFTPPAGEPVKLEGVNSFAITRDGIPVSTDLNITFMLDPGHSDEPREGRDAGQPPYDFNQTAVERAVYGHAYSEFEDLPWTKLPLRLAIDLWREMVKDKTLQELVNQEKTDTPPLQVIKDLIQARLTCHTIETRTVNGKRQVDVSREYSVLLSRGIRVLSVGGITDLYLPDDVRKERMLRWRETWAGDVQAALARAKEELKDVRHRGEAEACATLIRDLTTELRQQLGEGKTPQMRDSLRYVIQSAIRLCSQRGLVIDSTNLVIQLNEILDELSSLNANCLETNAGRGR